MEQNWSHNIDGHQCSKFILKTEDSTRLTLIVRTLVVPRTRYSHAPNKLLWKRKIQVKSSFNSGSYLHGSVVGPFHLDWANNIQSAVINFSMSQSGCANEHDRLDVILREAELLASQMRGNDHVGTQIEARSINRTDVSVEEMLQRADLLLSQMEPGSDGSSLSFSQNTSWQPSLDTNLDDMLEKADKLANQMRAKPSEPEVQPVLRKENPPNPNMREQSTSNDDVDPLAKAQLLASEIRSYQRSVDEADDSNEILSVDEMLHKAGILAVSMQYPPSTSGDENHCVNRNQIETPYLIRECDNLLENANWRDDSPHEILASTPELIRKTDRLIAQILHDETTELYSALSLDSQVDNMLRNTQQLLDQLQSTSSPLQHEESDPKNDLKSSSRPPRAPRLPGSPIKLLSPRHGAPMTPIYRNNIPFPDISIDVQESTARAAKSEEMDFLIQQTLTALTYLDSESDIAVALRVNAANMKRAIASFKNIPASTKPDPPESHTPTSVSIQAAADDELSSVGSGSARSLPLLMMSNSFNQGRSINKQDSNKSSSEKLRRIDVAVELSNQMAVELEATFSQLGDQEDHMDESVSNRIIVKSVLGDDSRRKLEEQRRWERISSVTTEDEDFARIMDLMKKKPLDPIQFEKLSNANSGDEDYVPLLDFRKTNIKTPSGQGTNGFEYPPSVRTSNLKARVRNTSTFRKKATRLTTTVLFVVIFWFAWSWIRIPTVDDDGNQVSGTYEASTEFLCDLVVDTVAVPLLDDMVNTETGSVSKEAESITQTFDTKAEIDERDHYYLENIQSGRRNDEGINIELVTIEDEEITVDELELNDYNYENDDDADAELTISSQYHLEESNSIDDFAYEEMQEIYGEQIEYSLEHEAKRIDRTSGKSRSETGGSDIDDKEQHFITDKISPLGFLSSNETMEELDVVKNWVDSFPSHEVEINIVHVHVPRGCLVPFSYLVSKNCREIARTKPLVDIHSITETMLQ